MAILADPLLLTIIAMVAGLCVSIVSKRAGLLIGVFGVVFLYLLAMPLVSQQLLAALEIELQEFTNPETVQPEAIVILGGDIRHRTPEFDGDTVGRLSLERIRYGAHLYRESGLPILTTGGQIGGSEKSVALVMAEALRADFQVRVRWMEEDSRNTFENASLSAEFLRAEGIDTIYLVTHSWHMPRALEAFQQVGVKAIPRPTGGVGSRSTVGLWAFLPHSGALKNSAFAMHEWIGRYWYRVRYY